MEVYLPDLEQDLRTHAEKAVDYPESENHRHAIDEPVMEAPLATLISSETMR